MNNDARKIGNVMWRMTDSRHMVPAELHGRISVEEEAMYDRVYRAAVTYRKLKPILHVVMNCRWQRLDWTRKYLKASFEVRSDARLLKASDDWDVFWSNLN